MQLYCERDRQFLCGKCLLNHTDHHNEVKELNYDETDEYLDLLEREARKIKEKSTKVLAFIKKCNMSISSTEALAGMKLAEELILKNISENDTISRIKGFFGGIETNQSY